MTASINANTTSGVVVTSDTSGSLALQTAGTTALTIDSSQQVGMGVTPSSWNAGVFRAFEGNSYASCIAFQTGGPSMKVGTNWYYNNSGNYVYKTTNAVSRMDYNDGYFSWYNAPSGTAGNTISFTQAMTLDASGNLGLGVTPSAWSLGKAIEAGYAGNAFWGVSTSQLSITQNAYYNGGFKYAANGYATRFQQNTGTYVWNIAPNNTSGAGASITFTDAMTLDTSGALVIGATAKVSGSTYLSVQGTAGASNIMEQKDNATSYGAGNYYQVYFNSSNGVAGGIAHTAATTVNFYTGSDVRLKEQIVDSPSVLQKVLDTKVRSYVWKEDQHAVQYGFIAQELYEHLPEAVGKGDDTETIENPNGTWQVEYGRLTPMLVKALQELSTQVTELKAEVQALKGN